MNILFIGKACPLETANSILQKSGQNPGFQIIKFMDLILKGLCYHQQKITILSNISNPKKMYSFSKAESKDSILYHYLPTIQIPILSQLGHAFFSFLYTLKWGLKTKGDKIIFCDIIASSSSCSGSLMAARLINIKKCMLLTDMITTPVTTALDTNKWWWNFFLKQRVRNQQQALKKYDSFVFLTKQMNDIYNPLNKPFIVMEGSVDSTFTPNSQITKQQPNIIMYAGAIEAEYGFNELVQAFMKLSNPNIELHIYGAGKFVNTLIQYSNQDNRIKYMGVVNNEQIVAAEQRATLLVNPRLTTQDFVKYSFPSKTSEYMLSGTPLLTTKLPGIPNEYFDYLYTYNEETIDGMAHTMQEIISLPSEELQGKGREAQKFVLENKNNIIQSKRLIDFFTQINHNI